MDRSAGVASGLAQALRNPDFERSALRAAFDDAAGEGSAADRLVAGAAFVLCLGIAGDDYGGFDAAASAVRDHRLARGSITDPALRLVADAGDLVIGGFDELGAPALQPLSDAVVAGLARRDVPPELRVAAALAVLSYFDAQGDYDKVLWLELVVRDIFAEEAPPPRLEGEWHRALVAACYNCRQPGRGETLRERRRHSGAAAQPAVELKLGLLDAYTALGEGGIEAGRAALERAEPLLRASAPYQASEWHFLASRLAMLERRLDDALNHARVAVRFQRASGMPDQWAGLTLMQEGHVEMARGRFFEAVPAFERGEKGCTGVQAGYARCLADLARVLGHAGCGEADAALDRLRAAFGFARERAWTGFLRTTPGVVARLCALALEADIEPEFARRVIAERRLEAAGPGAVEWPWPIRVRTLGRFDIELDGQPLAVRGKVARKPLELLQFIIAAGGSDVASSNAMFALWPDLDGDKAKSAFNVALHRLRKLLGRDDAVALELGRLSLEPRVVWVDCLAFESLANGLAAPLDTAGARAAERAHALYRGHFLQADEEHAWLMVQRSRLASKYKRLVRSLVAFATGTRDAAAARTLLERAIELDPLAEDLSLELMQVLAARGERAAALAVHQRSAAALQRLLGAQPSAAAREFAAGLRS